MDYIKLYNYYLTSKLTDVQITLNDGINSIQLKVHKLILSLSAPFFEHQFDFSVEDKIILNVDNAFIANDLIMSFYGQQTNYGKLEKWFHVLKTFQLRDYLGLENDATLLINLEVPAIGFELLLKVCELVGFDKECIQTINKNLPTDYDCFKLSNDLLNEMIESENYYKIISGSRNGRIQIWNSKTCDLIDDLHCHTNWVTSVTISSDNKLIAYVNNNNIIIWNADTSELIHKIYHYSCLSVSFSPNDKLIVSGSITNLINIWNVETGELINTINARSYSVKCVIFSPDNRFIVSGGNDHTIKIWNSTNYQLIKTLQGHRDWVRSVAISSNTKKIISGSDDATIKIWDIENGQLIKSIEAHSLNINCVDISPNDEKIISGSSDSMVKVWDAHDYHLIYTLNGNHNYSVKFSFDNKIIISGDHDHVKIWDAINYQLINTIPTNSIVNSVFISTLCETTLSKKLKNYLYQNHSDD